MFPPFGASLYRAVSLPSSMLTKSFYLASLDPGSALSFRLLVGFSLVKSGAGGGNRTHGLGIMRPSLYH